MLFNSIDFAVFLPVVFFFYWLAFQKHLRLQNLFVVAASYIFYGWWDWRFLILIFSSTVVDYWVGMSLGRTDTPIKRKMLLWTSLLINLGILGFFKYFNFFVSGFVSSFTLLGADIHSSSLNIILPVGISFYTLQTLSYSIDVYKRKLQPTTDFIAFAAFVSFFPQLVAGPIERASNLLPQFYKPRVFEREKSIEALKLMLWGLFKKVVIADSCALFANQVFGNYKGMAGSELLFGAICFTFQIYCDFSGYSDIARGVARLFGFEIMQNFSYPYFSKNIAEFWRRWHISLSTWFRDYLYIPLGGNRGSTWFKIRNVFIVFVVSGLWHGANWTFIMWGALHALFYLPLLLGGKEYAQGEGSNLRKAVQIASTFSLTMLAWVFFRAESLTMACDYLNRIVMAPFIDFPSFLFSMRVVALMVLLIGFLVVEWISKEHQFAFERIGVTWKRPWRWLMYYSVMIVIVWCSGNNSQEFVYFQF
ncbi:MBOAT family protein [Fulvivirga maritima]|uniref:MBOAT family O-acyltransferase n=1 Tax=Fulvivirga maritima TaxID=2904247 RepID=UPI001F322A17|nr:MBOAT family O-acyltransferase [Fulvivirga maritima]UII27923.1 MBOAT family protein [Fulvivirga maritima]